MAHPYWPLFDLRLRTERLELRLPTDEDLRGLVRAAQSGIHDPDEMPFGVAWTQQESPAFERSFAQFHWLARATWQPGDWRLLLAVVHDGEVIGSQGLYGRDFKTLRSAGTGSWLARSHQRRGLGREMRRGVLALAFDGLDAEIVTSEAFADNHASLGVSRSLGYEQNGVGRLAPQGVARDTIRFLMTRARWDELERERGWQPVQIEGLEACHELFG